MSEKVLLIDDDQDFLNVLSQRLAIREFDVTTASSVELAFQLVETQQFDVIILDLQMPEMDGLSVLERFIEQKPYLKILLLTGHATVAKGVQAMKLGALDVLEKPVDIRILTEKIKALAQLNNQRQTGDKTPSSSNQPKAAKGLFSKLFDRYSKNDS